MKKSVPRILKGTSLMSMSSYKVEIQFYQESQMKNHLEQKKESVNLKTKDCKLNKKVNSDWDIKTKLTQSITTLLTKLRTMLISSMFIRTLEKMNIWLSGMRKIHNWFNQIKRSMLQTSKRRKLEKDWWNQLVRWALEREVRVTTEVKKILTSRLLLNRKDRWNHLDQREDIHQSKRAPNASQWLASHLSRWARVDLQYQLVERKSEIEGSFNLIILYTKRYFDH